MAKEEKKQKPGPYANQLEAVTAANEAREDEETPVEKKQATKPWAENHWKRNMLGLKKKRKGMWTRWVSPENIQRYLDEGYTFAKTKDYVKADAIIGEAEGLDSQVKRRELTLMECPEKWHDEKKAYEREMVKLRTSRTTDEVTQTGRQLGVPTHDNTKS